MKGEMKKLLLPLIILGCLVVALIVYLVVDIVQKNNLEQELKIKTIEIVDATQVETIRIDSSKDGYITFSFDKDGKVVKADHNGEIFEREDLYYTSIEDLLANFSNLVLVKDLNDPSLVKSTYGLDPANYQVTFTNKDGSQSSLFFGDALSDKTGVYAFTNKTDSVVVAKYFYYENLSQGFENYLNQLAVSLDRLSVSRITFNRTSTNDKIVVKPQQELLASSISKSYYAVIEPIEREPSDRLTSLLDTMLNLQVNSFLPIKTEEYAKYGLDQPEYVFDYELLNGEKIHLILSKEIGGYYYGSISGNPYCFRVFASSLVGLNLPLSELIDFRLLHEYLNTVANVKVKMPEGTFEMEFQTGTSQSLTSDETVIRLDGRDAKVFSAKSGTCYGALLFTSIFNMNISRVDKTAAPVLGTPDASIFVTPMQGVSYSVKLQKVDASGSEYYCFINDAYSGFILDRSVLYRDNGQFLTDYGIWDAYELTKEAITNKDVNGMYDRVDKEKADA